MSEKELRKSVLCYLNENDTPGEKMPLSELRSGLDVPSLKLIIKVVRELHGKGLVEVTALGPSAMLCEITYTGKQMADELARQDFGESDTEKTSPDITARKSDAEIIEEFEFSLNSDGSYPEHISVGQNQSIAKQIRDVLENPSDKEIALRAILLNCSPFATDNELGAVFVDERISPWRTRIPKASNPVERVDAIITFLCDKYSDNRENALVLLLRVLSDQFHPKDTCGHQLTSVANELEHITTSPDITEITSAKRVDQMSPPLSIRSIPFIYGRPVQPAEFVNRQDALRTIFNRLRNGESTAVVGEPHIGKSSLLLKLADEATQQDYWGDDARWLVVSDLDHISSDYSPTHFWERATSPLQRRSDYASVGRWLEQIAQAGYITDDLKELFGYLHEQRQQLVLLLDEFEQLLSHPKLDFSFFATLRTLNTFPSFSFVTASRLSLNELNRHSYKLPGSGGSPPFNALIEMRLLPFDKDAIDTLLGQAGDNLSDNDRRFICRIAGRHPFLTQALAATLLETNGKNRHARAAERFYEQISHHFDDLWWLLNNHTRTTVVVLSLVELGSRTLGQDFVYNEIEGVDNLGFQLHRLSNRGMAERVGEEWQFDRDHSLLWRGERWTIGAQAFSWWVYDVVIAKTHQVLAYDEWLKDKCYRSLLTKEQWNRLLDAVRSTPERAAWGVGVLAQALFDELVRSE